MWLHRFLSRLALGCGLLLVLPPTALAADIPDKGLSVGIQGGAHLRLDTWDLHESLKVIDDAALLAPTAGIRLAVQPVWFLSLEASVGVTPYEGQHDSNVAMRYRGGVTFFPIKGDWQPSITVGGGAYHNVHGSHGSDVDAEAHWGLGVRGALTKNLTLRIEARHVMTDTYDSSAIVANNVEVLLGVDFFALTWGDVPQPQPKPKPLPKPEPKPEPQDSDGDGIPDDQDKCPEEKGVADRGGCPAPKIVKVVVTEQPISNGNPPPAFEGALHGIHFEKLRARIRPKSEPILLAVVDTFAKYPNLTVRIIGHTDSLAAHTFNQWLSEKRAKSVKKWLVQRGVDPKRIATEGRGEYEPVATNDNGSGRAKNRRIEFIILTR